MKTLIASFLLIISNFCYSASAVVLSEDNRVGVGYSMKSVDEAKIMSIVNCQIQTEKKCYVILSSGKPGWGAIVAGKDGFWVVLSEKSKAFAEILAMKECDQRYIACKLIDTFFDDYAAEEYSDIEYPENYKKPEPLKKENEIPKKLKNIKEIEI